jgi:LysR family transcriptional regulator, nod-box dependent transcriptional activator
MNLHLFDLNLLVALDALLSERNVTQAGNRLNLSQPAMSGALARLRSHFQDELLVPAGRRLVRTPLGEELVEPVREILLQVRGAIEAKKSFDPATSTRHFSIAASDYVVGVLMADVLRRVRCEAPNMTVELRVLGPRADEALDNGELDFLIAPPDADLDMHRTEVLFEETFTCVAWSKSTHVGDTLTPDEYLNLGHVIVNVGGGPIGNIDEVYLRKNKRRRRVEVSVPSFALAPQLVVGTDRITTITTRLALRCAEFLPLKLVPLPIEIPNLVEVLHWHRIHDKDPAHLWFRGVLKDMVASMDAVAGAATPGLASASCGRHEKEEVGRTFPRAVRTRT